MLCVCLCVYVCICTFVSIVYIMCLCVYVCVPHTKHTCIHLLFSMCVCFYNACTRRLTPNTPTPHAHTQTHPHHMLTHKHTYIHTHKHTHTHTHTNTHTHTHTLTHPPTHSPTHPPTHSPTHPPTHTHARTHARARTHTHARTHARAKQQVDTQTTHSHTVVRRHIKATGRIIYTHIHIDELMHGHDTNTLSHSCYLPRDTSAPSVTGWRLTLYQRLCQPPLTRLRPYVWHCTDLRSTEQERGDEALVGPGYISMDIVIINWSICLTVFSSCIFD